MSQQGSLKEAPRFGGQDAQQFLSLRHRDVPFPLRHPLAVEALGPPRLTSAAAHLSSSSGRRLAAMSETVKFVLGEDAHPDALGQPAPRPSRRPAAAAASRHRPARRTRRPRAALPDGADRAGGVAGADGRDPRRGPRRLPAVAADAAVPRAPARARRSTRPAHIYYKYEGVSPAGSHKPNTAVPQAYENAQAGVQQARDRDRRRPVGLVAGVRLLAVRPRVRGLHGRLVLRPEAVPALDDADLGRDGAPLAVGPDGSPAAARPRTRPARSGSRSPRRSRSRRSRRGHQLLARLGAEPRAAAPDGDRPGGDRADGARRRGARTSSSAASAAARTSPA